MIVNAEIRNIKKMGSELIKCLIPLGIWVVIMIGSLIIMDYYKRIGLVVFLISVIVFIPLFIWILIRANNGYKNTWITKEFDFYAIDGYLYLGNKKLHVNYNQPNREVYVHDLGDYKDPYEATFYGTIREPEVNMFLIFLENNKVIIEQEVYPILPGKYGNMAPLKIAQYRRLGR